MRQPGIRTDGETIFVENYSNFPSFVYFISLFSMWFFLLLRFKYISLLSQCEKAKPIDKPKKLALNHKNNIQRSLWFFSWLFFYYSPHFMLHWYFTPRKGALRFFEISIMSGCQHSHPRNVCLNKVLNLFVMLSHFVLFFFSFARK